VIRNRLPYSHHLQSVFASFLEMMCNKSITCEIITKQNYRVFLFFIYITYKEIRIARFKLYFHITK